MAKRGREVMDEKTALPVNIWEKIVAVAKAKPNLRQRISFLLESASEGTLRWLISVSKGIAKDDIFTMIYGSASQPTNANQWKEDDVEYIFALTHSPRVQLIVARMRIMGFDYETPEDEHLIKRDLSQSDRAVFTLIKSVELPYREELYDFAGSKIFRTSTDRA